MNVPFRVQQDIIGLDIAVYYSLAVDITQGAAEFCHPETNGFFGEGFTGDVKSKIATVHEIHNEIAGGESAYAAPQSCLLYLQILKVLKTVPQVA